MISLHPSVLEPRNVGETGESLTQLGRTTIVIASEAKQSRSRRAPSGPLDRRVASLLAMTIPFSHKLRKLPAVRDHDRRARPVRAHERPRPGPKKVIPPQP